MNWLRLRLNVGGSSRSAEHKLWANPHAQRGQRSDEWGRHKINIVDQ